MSSSNFSGVHLNDIPLDEESAPVTQNILAPTEKHRSAPHLISSVAPGNERQYFRSCSMFIRLIFPCVFYEFCEKQILYRIQTYLDSIDFTAEMVLSMSSRETSQCVTILICLSSIPTARMLFSLSL